MDQTVPNSNQPYNFYGLGTPMLDNDGTGLTMDNSLSPFDLAFDSSSPLEGNFDLQNTEVDLNLDTQDFGPTMMPSPAAFNNASFDPSSQSNTRTGSLHASPRGNTPRGTTTQYPYPHSQRRGARAQAQAQRGRPQRTPARRRAVQNGTNAFTLPRSRLNNAQTQGQSDLLHGQNTTIGQMSHVSGASSGSISPFNPADLAARGDALTYDTIIQAPTYGDYTATGEFTFVRPVHHQLDSSRVDPAGPEPHPDPNWRAPGSRQWTEILYDYTLLRYLPDAGIKEIMKYCEKLASSGDPANPPGAELIEGGPYTVLDAQVVWNYCTAYSKRRQQHRNNSAACRSRNNKAAQLKHWKALALAAGAPDRDFVYDANDEGNAPDAPPTLLAAVTQEALVEMRSSWATATSQGQHAPAVSQSSPVPELAPQPSLQQPRRQQPQIQQSQRQIQQPQIQIQQPQIQQPPEMQQHWNSQHQDFAPALHNELASERRNSSRAATMAPQSTDPTLSGSGPLSHSTALSPIAAPPILATSTPIDDQQSKDNIGEPDLDLSLIQQELLRDLDSIADDHDVYNNIFDFDNGIF